MSDGTPKARTLPKRGSRRGWFWSHNLIIDGYGHSLGIHAVAVYQALAMHAGKNGECHPAYETLAWELGTSRLTVIRSIKTLESAGLIRVEPRYNKGGRTSNLFTLLEPDPCQAPPQVTKPRRKRRAERGICEKPGEYLSDTAGASVRNRGGIPERREQGEFNKDHEQGEFNKSPLAPQEERAPLAPVPPLGDVENLSQALMTLCRKSTPNGTLKFAEELLQNGYTREHLTVFEQWWQAGMARIQPVPTLDDVRIGIYQAVQSLARQVN